MFEKKKPFKKPRIRRVANQRRRHTGQLPSSAHSPPSPSASAYSLYYVGTTSTFYPNFFLIIVPPKPPPLPRKAIKSAPSRAIEVDTKALFFFSPPGRGRACHTITYCYARMEKN